MSCKMIRRKQGTAVSSQQSAVRSQNLRHLFSAVCFLPSVFCILFFAMGCEAFVRKFTRKPKTENLPREEMVLEPKVYEVLRVTADERYKQDFLFWKSWTDELIESLAAGASHKKQQSCIREAIENFSNLRNLVDEGLQKKMDVYIAQLKAFEYAIDKDTYGNNFAANRQAAERLKRNILRDFSYNKIKDHLRQS